MKITRKSVITGAINTREINITPQQYADYLGGNLAQIAFPLLSSEDREFIISGVTSDEWDKYIEELAT